MWVLIATQQSLPASNGLIFRTGKNKFEINKPTQKFSCCCWNQHQGNVYASDKGKWFTQFFFGISAFPGIFFHLRRNGSPPFFRKIEQNFYFFLFYNAHILTVFLVPFCSFQTTNKYENWSILCLVRNHERFEIWAN